jgi:hypothetical protein
VSSASFATGWSPTSIGVDGAVCDRDVGFGRARTAVEVGHSASEIETYVRRREDLRRRNLASDLWFVALALAAIILIVGLVSSL